MSLNFVHGKVIIEIDLQAKNSHTFSDGTKIRLERQYENFNRRETEPVNAVVVSAENIPTGSQILIHPNSIHDTNKIFNHEQLSGTYEGSDIKYYSIPEDQCFLWLDGNNVWQPIFPFETALRVYEPYCGPLVGIEPKLIKNTLFVTSGLLKGEIVRTIVAVDYEVIFQGTNGQEQRIIRFRPFGDEKAKREEEAIAIDNHLTKKYYTGELLVGLSPSESKPIKGVAYAD